ncbi:MAG: DUF4126 domain-containing protein [Phycisphaerales bacterium]|nr:DUF4126 domain-containing protein [Phycisphaerales bacterium]
MEDSLSYGFAALVGFALSAACGMRIFAPLAIISVAAHYGWIDTGDGFAWIATTPAMLCFVVACTIEIVGMLVPIVDHVLDVAGAPVAAVAGTLVMASQLANAGGVDTSGVPAWATWALAAVVGGGVAVGIHAAAGTVRVGSTAVSGGVLNPVFSIIETVGSLMVAVLAIVVPVLAVIAAIALIAGLLVTAWIATKLLRRARRADGRKKGSVSEVSHAPR